MFYLKFRYVFLCISTTIAVPQQPEINDQFETTDGSTKGGILENIVLPDVVRVTSTTDPQTEIREHAVDESFTSRIYSAFTMPIIQFISTPKVSSVLRNIGVCIVNGAMEIITHYLPAPLIPLIASAAGMVIPFEPVVLLKERMPVTSYRRAFRSAMSSFMGTFDKYKVDDEDPYMTRRFNRRLNYDSQEKDRKNVQVLLKQRNL